MILSNKNILIIGAAGLIGSQVAKAILKEGARVFLIDINLKGLRLLEENLKKKKINKFNIFKLDITNEKNLKSFANTMKKKNLRINGIVNLVAVDPKIKNSNSKSNLEKFTNLNLQKWNIALNVGLTGTVLMFKYFIPLIDFRKQSSIVNVASDLSIISPDHRLYSTKINSFSKPISYSVIKHGIIGLTKYLSTYYANKNLRVNSISPGGIENSQPKKFIKKISRLIPLGRMAKTEEYNDLIIFLLSDKSSYITGTNIVADGGRSII